MKLKVLALSLAMIGLMGCKDFSSPRGVVGTAGEAIKKNKLADFQETLTGNAMKEWGSAAGMAKLQQKIAGIKKVKLQRPALLSSVSTGHWMWNEVHNVQILGDGSLLGDATTLCHNRKYIEHGESCHTSCHSDGEGHTWCNDICHPTTTIRTATSCRITDLNVK